MNKSKGFTIIELIVVIAIIAILAAIVLVNVTVYINKAKDARINSDVASVALGENSCFSDKNGTTYVGCNAATTFIPATLLTDIDTNNGQSAANSRFLTEATGTYVFCARMASDLTKAACVDYTGVTKSGTTASPWASCTGSITTCP